MVHFMSVVTLVVLILEFLDVVTNTGAGHHTGHHAGHHINHGHRGRQGHSGSGAGRHNKYGGQGGNNCRHDHGHVAGGRHRDQVPSMHRSGGKKSFNPISYILNSENKQPRKSAAHAKKKGHADTAHSQTTQREVNPGKSNVLDDAECNHNIITY